MCGIAGVVGKNARGKESAVRDMTNALAHRGPDGDGFAAFDTCVLGHRRLAIVDLSDGGKQPMFDAAKKVAVTFNGEIYGYKELKYQISNYKFQTNSDTEVILALYEKYSEKLVEHLPGMFAFALWDDTTQTLIAARDRFGEKPFYYARTPAGDLIFASEIKGLLASGLITPELDQESLAHYLHKLYVHPACTIYKNIHTLPPAHMLTYKNGEVAVSRYWELPQTTESITLNDVLPEFARLLTDAVRKQLVADVPVGAFLSGGLDSTTIVSLASEIVPKIKTFAFGFNSSKNELHFARMAAQKYGTEHHELNDTDYDIADVLQKMAEVYDEPFADSSNIPTYLISKQARAHTTVALSGDGGDEMLGGYGGYKTLLPQGLLAGMLERFVRSQKPRNSYFGQEELGALGISATLPLIPAEHTPDDAMRNDIEDFQPGNNLVKTDRASMAHGLELRAPFLDWPLAEFLISLPYQLKLNAQEDKILLRRAFGGNWPEPIRTRNKQGFGGPVTTWLTHPKVRALIHGHLDDPSKKIFTYVGFEASRPYVQKNDYKTWILLVLSLWMEKNLR